MVVWVAIAGWPSSVGAVSVPIVIDTTSMQGHPGLLAFDFIDGDSVVNNTVMIIGAGFASPVTLDDTLPFVEVLQLTTFGPSLDFTLEATTNFATTLSAVPDALSLFFLDVSGTASLVTSADPTGADTVLRVDLIGGVPGVNAVLFPFTPVPVPEPSTLLLVGLMLPVALWACRLST
jgi:hypothetical protein